MSENQQKGSGLAACRFGLEVEFGDDLHLARAFCELRIWPNRVEVMVCEAGLAKIGVLNRLKASPRSSKYLLLGQWNCLLSERSKRLMPGPRSVPTPILP